MKILVADDDKSIRYMLKMKLENWGYDVLLAENGNQAIDILKSNDSPKIAIIDWIMPDYTGIEICEHFNDGLNLTYFIMMTSLSSEEDMIKAIDMGAHNFLAKPVSFPILKRFIEVGNRLVNYEENILKYEKKVRLQCYSRIANMAEAIDEYSVLHLKRVEYYTRALCEQLKLSFKETYEISKYSSLHDIGKIGIPESIMLAPRKLTKIEFEKVKTHCYLGAKMLKDVSTMELASDIALFHHEKWNGEGYPFGEKEKKIPLAARIVALVDVYDSLRCVKPYKDAWSHEKTIKYIISQSGIHFDPNIVEAFKEIHYTFDEIYLKNKFK